MMRGSRIAAMQMLAAAVAAASGGRPTVGVDVTPSPPPFDHAWSDTLYRERVIAARSAIAGKPWKRGGRQTIRQRRALAFAVRRAQRG